MAENAAKGNPARIRASNAKRQARHAAGWANVERAKKDGTHRTVRNRLANEAAHAEKVANNGLGRRERRRIASGKRLAPSLG